MSDDAKRGLYGKYRVDRNDGSSGAGGKHERCEYFVLDLVHDKYAFDALNAYAAACREEYPQLASDLTRRMAGERTDELAQRAAPMPSQETEPTAEFRRGWEAANQMRPWNPEHWKLTMCQQSDGITLCKCCVANQKLHEKQRALRGPSQEEALPPKDVAKRAAAAIRRRADFLKDAGYKDATIWLVRGVAYWLESGAGIETVGHTDMLAALDCTRCGTSSHTGEVYPCPEHTPKAEDSSSSAPIALKPEEWPCTTCRGAIVKAAAEIERLTATHLASQTELIGRYESEIAKWRAENESLRTGVAAYGRLALAARCLFMVCGDDTRGLTDTERRCVEDLREALQAIEPSAAPFTRAATVVVDGECMQDCDAEGVPCPKRSAPAPRKEEGA